MLPTSSVRLDPALRASSPTRRRVVATAFAVLCALSGTRLAWADVLTVTSGEDSVDAPVDGSLRKLVTTAKDGDVIEIPGGVTVELRGDLSVGTPNVTIRGTKTTVTQLGTPVVPSDRKQGAPPRLVLTAPGQKIEKLALERAGIRVESGAASASITDCAISRANVGIEIDGAAKTEIGRVDAGVKFEKCKDAAITARGTTDVVISDVDVGRCKLSIDATDSSGLDVRRAKITDSSGVVLKGTGAKISDSTITPGKGAGVRVSAAVQPGAPPRRSVTIDRCEITVKGKANAVSTDGSADVTVDGCTLRGSHSRAPVVEQVAPSVAAGTPPILSIVNTQLTGGAPASVRTVGDSRLELHDVTTSGAATACYADFAARMGIFGGDLGAKGPVAVSVGEGSGLTIDDEARIGGSKAPVGMRPNPDVPDVEVKLTREADGRLSIRGPEGIAIDVRVPTTSGDPPTTVWDLVEVHEIGPAGFVTIAGSALTPTTRLIIFDSDRIVGTIDSIPPVPSTPGGKVTVGAPDVHTFFGGGLDVGFPITPQSGAETTIRFEARVDGKSLEKGPTDETIPAEGRVIYRSADGFSPGRHTLDAFVGGKRVSRTTVTVGQ